MTRRALAMVVAMLWAATARADYNRFGGWTRDGACSPGTSCTKGSVPVAVDTVDAQFLTIPDCDNATTSKLLFDTTASPPAFSCGTDQTGGGGTGDIDAVGNCTVGSCFVDGTNNGNQIVYEGATINANQTTLTFTGDPAAAYTVTIPNETGTLCTTGAVCTGYTPTTRTLTGGAGIAALGDLSADRTVTFDATELGAVTWGSGSGFAWTFNAGATDPVITFGSGTVNVSTGTLQQGGSAVLLSGASAGGDLTGTYPSPTIGLNTVALGTDTTNDYVATITAGAGIASTGATSGETISHTLSTASQKAAFLADGGAVDLTCGASNQGKMQVMDVGTLQFCDGATTSVLRTITTGAGTGDVVGPASSTTRSVARYADTTGKLIQDTVGVNIQDDYRTSITAQPTATTAVSGLLVEAQLDPTAAHASTQYGVRGIAYTKTAAVDNYTASPFGIVGVTGSGEHHGTGIVTGAAGVNAVVSNQSGVAGRLDSGYALYAQCQQASANDNMDTCYAAYLAAPNVSAGSIVTSYGLYQADNSSLNYFAGPVGIGRNASMTLDVGGSMAVQNQIDFDNTLSPKLLLYGTDHSIDVESGGTVSTYVPATGRHKWLTGSTQRMTLTSTGLKIGSTGDATVPFEVTGDAVVTDQLAVGGTIQTGAGQYILHAATESAGYGLLLNENYAPAAAGGSAYGVFSRASTADTDDVTRVVGLYGEGRRTATSGAATWLIGVEAYGNDTSATGTATNVAGVYAKAENTTSATAYGVYIDNTVATTNQWGVYQSATTDSNYFAGNVGIGIAPAAKLHVDAAVDGIVRLTHPSFSRYLELGGSWPYIDSYGGGRLLLNFQSGEDVQLGNSVEIYVDSDVNRVGILTNTPGYGLDVATTVQLQQTVTIGGAVTTSSTVTTGGTLTIGGQTRLWKTDTPGTCNSVGDGALYHDISMGIPCVCRDTDGSGAGTTYEWRRIDDTATACS